jgi:hypothetical protein
LFHNSSIRVAGRGGADNATLTGLADMALSRCDSRLF